MKVLQLNYSDINGGAARAAYRIHHALRASGVDSTFVANVATAGDWTVQGPTSKVAEAWTRVRPQLGVLPTKLLRTRNPIIHSPSILPSGRVHTLNARDTDVLHLHWVQGEMLSVSDLGGLKKPVIWTLHDMWAFCGAEHYTEEFRWRDGYRADNRPAYESGFDLNRWTWIRKRKHWQRPMHIVTPSRWLADCVQESALMRDWPVSVVPNCLDTERWKPLDKSLARQLLGLPSDEPLLLFGAMGGGNDPRKGFDLLLQALGHLRGEMPDLNLVVFGQLAPREPLDLGFPIHYTGHLHDDLSLRTLYSAADALVIPSRQDNLPNTGVEALACGTPVVAFNVCGLPDLVQHQNTGYLAKAFDAHDLAYGIKWTLSNSDRHKIICKNSRLLAKNRFGYSMAAEGYIEVYKRALTT